MTTLYLAWQHRSSRRWFPVGRLVRRDASIPEFEFAYIQGAREAVKCAGFKTIPAFPSLETLYRSSELFPTFRNRVMNGRRVDRPVYLQQLGLNASTCDELTELSVSGGRSYSDTFEVFPPITPDPDGRFRTQLMLHGLRHTNPHAVEAVQRLRPHDELRVAIEMNNPVATQAILVCTQDYYVLGWLPRYVAEGIHRGGSWTVAETRASVARVNPDAPLSHQVLLDFGGRLPPGVDPMRDLQQYQPITEPGPSVMG